MTDMHIDIDAIVAAITETNNDERFHCDLRNHLADPGELAGVIVETHDWTDWFTPFTARPTASGFYVRSDEGRSSLTSDSFHALDAGLCHFIDIWGFDGLQERPL